MTGSNAVAIVTPIVALITLAFWLGLVFYAGSHPFWRGQEPPRRDQLANARPPSTLPPASPGQSGAARPAPAPGSPATAAGSQRITPS